MPNFGVKTLSKEKKQLFSNVFSLGILQIANYIIPLLTLPYLTRVLGVDLFGLLAFSTAMIGYFLLVTEYGFNLSLTRQISIFRNDLSKISEIYSAAMMIRFFLMIICLFFLVVLVFIFDKFYDHKNLYFITFGLVFGQFLFPSWIFQGLEKMKYISFINIFSKLFSMVLIFLFVNQKSDYLLVPIFNSLAAVLSGFFALYFIHKKLSVKFCWQRMSVLKFQLFEGWYVFLSNISISFYTISTVFILGLFTNNYLVGIFSSADKIIQAIKGIYTPISRAIYPLVSNKIHNNKKEGVNFVKKFLFLFGFLMFFISFLLFVFSEYIVRILFGDSYNQAVLLVEIMSFLPFIIFLSNVFGIQLMVNLGYKKEFSKILFFGAILGILLNLLLVYLCNEVGSAISVLMVEIFVTISMFVFLSMKRRELYAE